MLAHARAVDVLREWHFGGRMNARHHAVEVGSDELLTDLVDSAGPLLDRIVVHEHAADRRDDLVRGGRDQERGERAMVRAELLRCRQRLAASQTSRLGQKDLLLHGDVAKQPRTELLVGLVVDRVRRRDGPLQELVEALVIVLEETMQWPWHAAG